MCDVVVASTNPSTQKTWRTQDHPAVTEEDDIDNVEMALVLALEHELTPSIEALFFGYPIPQDIELHMGAAQAQPKVLSPEYKR